MEDGTWKADGTFAGGIQEDVRDDKQFVPRGRITDSMALQVHIAGSHQMPCRLIGADGKRLFRRQIRGLERVYYVKDFFLTLVVCRWAYTLLAVALIYSVSWTAFAGLWYELHTTDSSCLHLSHSNSSGDFNTMFLFSVAIQTTIGFGNDYIQDDCRVGALLLVVQSVVGLILDAVLLGLVLTKASRSKSRARTFVFSDRGVICRRNGRLCLLWRIADLRKRGMCEAHVRAYCYKSQTTLEGEQLDWECTEMDLGYDTGRDRVLTLLPVTVCHFIGESSPLHGMPPELLATTHLEIVLMLEGVIEATGLTVQAMRSYTNQDIRWGYSFSPMVKYSANGKVTVDYAELNAIRQMDMGGRQ